jgi:glyoxylase-like metal-dependent hydrolase (beta-lactamase superfamily II)/8-oxo-dGTP pyrophosphatase MutT (NUDIX family)
MDSSTEARAQPPSIDADPAAQVRPAATVVLLRPRSRGFDVLLTQRAPELRFMGGATVFPGGAAATADFDPAWRRASNSPGSEDLGARVCALREAFEEVGWVSGDGPVEHLTLEDAADPERWLERCLELRIRLDTDRLVSAGRWVTPLGSPVRFDAHFFLTIVDDFEPRLNAPEVVSCRWLTAEEGLDELAGGRMVMAPPTIEMLQRLNAYDHAPDALAALASGSKEIAGDVLVARLSPLVQAVLAPNPGLMTGPGTNTYVVGAGRDRAVIDVAVPDGEYLDAIVGAAGRVSSILVTHRHPDHVGGVAALAGRTGAPVRAFGSEPAGGSPVEPVADGVVLETGGVRLRTLFTPGHAADHLCWLLEGTASLFSGDNVLGEGTAVISPPEGDMGAYLRSLKRLNELDIQRIYPGHWRALDGGNAVLESYLTHRTKRREAILASLKPFPKSPEEIVAEVYADTAPELHRLARQSVIAHLLLLESEGLVAGGADRWTLVPAPDGRGGRAE